MNEAPSGPVGVTLGKFAPFHKGHRYMIQQSVDHESHTYVFVYPAPGLDVPELSERADWIRDEFSDEPVTVLEAWVGPTNRVSDDWGQAIHEKYIVDRLRGLGGEDLLDRVDGFFSSEQYGLHMAEGLDCLDYRVDMERTEFPVSGTAVREDPYGNRDLVPDHVYEDLVTSVLITGAPSTGKTTLTKALANEFDTEWQPEYGREYWHEHEVDGLLTNEQLRELAREHEQREKQKLRESDEYTFVDTGPLATLNFSRWYYGEPDEKLEQMAKEITDRYDYVMVCSADIPFEDEVGRGEKENRQRFQNMTRDFLRRYNIGYHVLSGSVEDRIKTAKAFLGET